MSTNIKSSPVKKTTPAVEAMLLQKHKSCLVRLTVTRMLSRVICLLAGAYISLASSISSTQINVLYLPLVVIIIWLMEEYSVNDSIDEIEAILARRSDSDLEDRYIRSRSRREIYPAAYIRPLKLEALAWFMVLFLLFILRIVFRSQTGTF
jgi:hypothetical protein